MSYSINFNIFTTAIFLLLRRFRSFMRFKYENTKFHSVYFRQCLLIKLNFIFPCHSLALSPHSLAAAVFIIYFCFSQFSSSHSIWLDLLMMWKLSEGRRTCPRDLRHLVTLYFFVFHHCSVSCALWSMPNINMISSTRMKKIAIVRYESFFCWLHHQHVN